MSDIIAHHYGVLAQLEVIYAYNMKTLQPYVFTEKLATKSLIFFPLPVRATFGGEFEKKCSDLTEKFHSKFSDLSKSISFQILNRYF